MHLAMVAMGGNLGLKADIGLVPSDGSDRGDIILFSESSGRFIVTVSPGNRKDFEKMLKGLPSACIGEVTEKRELVLNGSNNRTLVSLSVDDLKKAWKRPFGELI
ncbi:MAG: phosphoribosylformylglycinamidine synthase subunit PurSL [Thermodesulfobacteriota bacterium]|nr:phosphoribosylformylglycinamidine synthase subunit PurSL [Thermodesulfobacteriota bacterium]